jgi:hypothetical protein
VLLDTHPRRLEMQNGEDRSTDGKVAAALRQSRTASVERLSRFIGKARSAPRGSESRIGDDETHRRLQEARNRARHSTEDMVRRELGPEWAEH